VLYPSSGVGGRHGELVSGGRATGASAIAQGGQPTTEGLAGGVICQHHNTATSQDHKIMITRSQDHSIFLNANVLPQNITRSQDHKITITKLHNHNITRSPEHSICLVANALSPVEWWSALQAASTAGTGSRHCAAAQRGDPQSLKEAS
jgi:hypothetical protein